MQQVAYAGRGPGRSSGRAERASSRVLVVEDSPSDFAMLEIALRSGALGEVLVERASTLAKAVERLRVQAYDCVLVDLGLPDSDGIESFEGVFAEAGCAAVLVLTGLDNQALAEEAVRLGAQDYLVKGDRRSGQVARAVGYAIQRQQLLAGLRRATVEQLALKDQFLSHVSHELRSPLAVVHQFGSLLADGVAGPVLPEQRELLDVLMRNVDQLTLMIDDLLDASRGGRGAPAISCEPLDLRHLLGEVAAAYRPLAERSQIVLTLDVVGQLPQVVADPKRVREVLANLVDNAMKFTPAGGTIGLSATPTADDVTVTVSDTGCGIAETAQAKIFEKFFQAQHTDDGGRRGLGLGLFVSNDLVAAQGGRMWVESSPGRGTSLSFTLPRDRSRAGTEVLS